MKGKCLWSVANTQVKVKRLIKLDVQLRQRVATANFLVGTNLATDMILSTAYIDKNNEKISPKKGILQPTSASPTPLEEFVGNSACMTEKLRTKEGPFEDEYSE